MNVQAMPLVAAPQPVPAWPRGSVAGLLLALALVLALHYPTLSAMVALWWRSQTFAHGFLILPISAWLVWQRRHLLARQLPVPSVAALGLLALLGAAWLLGALANVPSLQQYMVVAMVGATVIAVAGTACARTIAFPLGYLLLAVPFGEVLVPPLIDFTASFTVTALQLSGVPVLRENNYLTLPNGNWSVVDACSGLRYVIASVALGTLYAWLNFRDTGRRLLFIAVAMLLPVLANGVRAYLIVLIGYASDMRLAAGIDHLIYGWLFFGLVCLLLFWCGRLWRGTGPAAQMGAAARARTASAVPNNGPADTLDDTLDNTPDGVAGETRGKAPAGRRPVRPALAASPVWRACLYCTAITACWPLLAAAMQGGAPAAEAPPPLGVAEVPAPWRRAAWDADSWRLPRARPALSYAASFSDGAATVSLQLAWYRRQASGAELLAPAAAPQPAGLPAWQESTADTRVIVLGPRRLAVQQLLLRNGGKRRLVWRWYRQDGLDTASPVMVKLLLAKARLLRQPEDGAAIAVAADADDMSTAAATLERFLRAALPSIDRGLRHAGR
ncbi:MAG: exosortase A [Pseudomonadota bacterium]